MRKMLKLKNYHLVAAVVTASVFGLFTANTGAAAPGCSGSRPTAITGTLVGYGGSYHNWTVNVLIGMDFIDGYGHKVNPDGSRAGAGYSYVDKLNQNLPMPGVPTGGERTFGASQADGNGVLCVASNVKTAWFEVYPKDGQGITNKDYYGEANAQRLPVNVGATNSYGLRLPTSHGNGGNTGDVNGYIKYNGHSINPSALRITTFTTSPGMACGVHGFSAGADAIGVSSSQNATYYLVRNLAGGQCYAATQQYKITVKCASSACGTNRSITQIVYVANGARPRLDFKF